MTVQAGRVRYPARDGVGSEELDSCETCAVLVGLKWFEALFEGECVACGEGLSGNPSADREV